MASLNRSSLRAKQLSKAAGEAIVVYKLSRQGWLVVNANSGIQNIPNFDLIAMKGKRNLRIQVKAARGNSHVPLAGKYKLEGRYFNTKKGERADVVAFVALGTDDRYNIFFVPVNIANRLTRKLGDGEAKQKKKRGSSLNFPLWCRFKGKTSSPHKKAAMRKIQKFQDAVLDKVI